MSASTSLPRSSSQSRLAPDSDLPISMSMVLNVSCSLNAPKVTGSKRRVSGLRVVSHNCSALISPRPLKREICQALSRTPSLRSLSSIALSSLASRASIACSSLVHGLLAITAWMATHLKTSTFWLSEMPTSQMYFELHTPHQTNYNLRSIPSFSRTHGGRTRREADFEWKLNAAQ